jgi:hypothetical protein
LIDQIVLLPVKEIKCCLVITAFHRENPALVINKAPKLVRFFIYSTKLINMPTPVPTVALRFRADIDAALDQGNSDLTEQYWFPHGQHQS